LSLSKRVLTVAVIAGVMVASAPAYTASADTPEPITPSTSAGLKTPQAPPKRFTAAQKTQASNCAAVRKNLSNLARAGKAVATCVEAVTSPSAAAWTRLRSEDFRTLAIQPLPDWCIDNAFTGWWYTRTEICAVDDLLLNVINTNTGGVIGTMNFLQLSYEYTSASIGTWAFQIELRPYDQENAAVGSAAIGTVSCSGSCTTARSTFPLQPVSPTENAEGEALFNTTVATPGTVGTASTTWTYWFENPTWTPPTSTPVAVTPPLVKRCDNATPGNSAVGCVVPDYEPVEIASLSVNPNYARHIRDAQASGLPGAYPNGTPLTRMTDQALSDRNGDTACPASYTRPSGFSCDEYPFRSTWQGAFTGGGSGRTFSWCQIPQLPTGVTGSSGYSACMIPAGENSSGGGFLQGFYRSNRVIEVISTR